MNYSRRQLEALGEPLGESVTQVKPGGFGRIYGGGGGGGGTSTTYTSNIPEWMRPQVEALLGAGTQEYFSTKDVKDPETGKVTKEITGVKPFTPYSTRPEDYVAGFSPLQQQTFFEAANMQRPGQFADATQFAGLAGTGGLESAQQAYGYGQMGAGYGAQAADIGQMALAAQGYGRDVGEEARQFARQAAGMGGAYERMATDPYSIQQYMSPYMQNVVDLQQQAAIRDAQKANLAANLGAARAGTYGGARQLLATTERERALGSQLQNIQAQGLQKAYEDAQRAQQYGAELGLRGLTGAQAGLGTALQGGQLGLSGIGQAIAGQQAGMQGAQVGLQGVSGAQAGYGLTGQMGKSLADIAAQQQAADIARMELQGRLGAQQQAREQQVINQAVQNYAMAQEYPYEQLSKYSGLIRGYYTPSTTATQYQAAPSLVSQAAGLGTAGVGLAGMANLAGVGRKAGGKVKEKHYEEGGITSIDQKIINDPTAFSPEIINRGIKSGSISEMAGAIGLSAIKNAQNQAKQQQGLAQGAPEGTILGDLQKQVAGIDTLPSNLPTRYAASGGIIAFAGEDGSLVEDIVEKENREIAEGTRLTYSPQAVQAMKSKTKDGNQEYLLREQQRMLSGNPMMSSYRQPSSAPAAALATPAAAQAAAYPQEGTRGTASMTRPGGPPGMDLKQIPPTVYAAAVPTASQTSAGPAAPQRLTTDEDGMKQMSVADFKRQQKEFGVSEDPMAEAKAKIASMAGESKLDREFAKNMAFLRAGLGMMSGTSQYALQNIGKGATEGVTQYAQDIKDIKSTERELFKLQTELAKADDARVRGDFKGFQEYNQNARDHMLKLKKLGLDERQVKAYEKAMGRPSDEQLRQQMFREDPAAFRRMQESMRPGFESAQTQRDKAMLEQINNALLTMKKDDPQRKMLEEQRQRIMGRMSGQVETLPPNVQAVIDKYLPKT